MRAFRTTTRSWSPRAAELRLRWLVAAGVACGAAMRVWILASPLGRVDDDEAVVGLIAQHILDHGDLRTFFWGQSYGGIQEPLAVSLVFLITGSGVVALKLVPVLFHVGAALLTWRIGLRTTDAVRARVAAVIVWVFPGVYVWWSTKARGFYGTTLVLGLVVVLAALRFVECPNQRDAALLGGAAGLGLWASPHIAYFVVPTLVWLAWVRRHDGTALLRPLAVAAVAAVVGAAPWLLYNIRREWRSVDFLMSGEEWTLGSLGRFFTVLPVALGLRQPYSDGWAVPLLTVPAYALVLGALLWIVLRRPAGSGVLVAVVALYPLLWSRQQFLLDAQAEAPRYLYYVVPPLVLLLVGALRSWPQQVGAVGASVALSVWGLVWLARPGTGPAEEVRPADTGAILRVLDREGVRELFGVNACYGLSFVSERKVICSPVAPRERRYDRVVRASPRPAFLADARTTFFDELVRELRRIRVGYRTEAVSVYRLVLPEARVLPTFISPFVPVVLERVPCRGPMGGCRVADDGIR